MTIHRGHCRCGAAQMEVEGPPVLTSACHCRGCQRMTSGPYALSALYAEDRFTLGSGPTVIGGLRGATQHYFCPTCLSWLFTRPDGLENMVNIRTPLLEDAASFPPFVELYRAEGLQGIHSGAPHSFERAPGIDEFLRLAESYAQWRGVPA